MSAPDGPVQAPSGGLAGHRAIVNILDVFRSFWTSPDVSGSVAIMNNSADSASPTATAPSASAPETTDLPHASTADSFLTPSVAVSDYEPAAIEARWQAAWLEQRAFAVPPPEDARAPAYVFAGCPFTSGDAHMGHIRSYTISDAYARFLRARGDAVLFSLGFDSFGLPAELEAVRRGVTPQAWVARCVERMRGQFERLGYSCDWERTFVSSEPDYYRWTQWLFLATLEKDLIYQHVAQVSCVTLARQCSRRCRSRTAPAGAVMRRCAFGACRSGSCGSRPM